MNRIAAWCGGLFLLVSVLSAANPLEDPIAFEGSRAFNSFVDTWLDAYQARNTTALVDQVDPGPGVLFVMSTGQRLLTLEDVRQYYEDAFAAMDSVRLQKTWANQLHENDFIWGAFMADMSVYYGAEALHVGLLQSVVLKKREKTWKVILLHESATTPMNAGLIERTPRIEYTH